MWYAGVPVDDKQHPSNERPTDIYFFRMALIARHFRVDELPPE
jgi:hypothetical protein